MALDWRRLRATERLVRRRRLAGRPLALHPLVLLGAAAVGASAGLAALQRGEAHVLWLGGVLGAAILIVVAAPFRMFWRPDSGFLGRLPIAGEELYRLAAWRTLETAAPLAVVLTFSALGLGEAPLALARHVAYAVALLAGAAAAAPATGALAGALVVSERTQGLLHGATGQTAPPTAWLSVIPGAGAMGLVIAGYLAVPWLVSGAPMAVLPLAAALLAAVAALLVVRPLAGRTLAAATREVAALDAVRLAHVDRVGAGPLERLAGRLLPRGGRLVYGKDLALVRRRHPGYYLLTGLGVVVLWIVAFTAAAPAREPVALVGATLMGAYAVLFGRRLAGPPAEVPRLLRSLPIPPAHALAAKRLAVGWRAGVTVLFAGAPAVARAETPATIGLALAGVFVGAVIAGSALARVR